MFDYLKIVLILSLFGLDSYSFVQAEVDIPSIIEKDIIIKKEEFSFNKIKLLDFINFIASKKGISIVLPGNVLERSKLEEQTITYSAAQDLYLNEAWRLLLLFLELAGFSIVEQTKNIFIINIIPKKDVIGIWQNKLPVYINSPIEKLLNLRLEEPIRYIYYFSQIIVSPEVIKLIDFLKSPNSPSIVELKEQNGILITDFASNISSLVNILTVLDNKQFKQVVSVIPIYNVSANYITELFNKLKTAAVKSNGSADVTRFGKLIQYTNIIPYNSNNSVILLGPEEAVEKIGNFLQDQFDEPLKEANSVLHVYDVQYLDAAKLALVLQDFVSPKQTPGQSTAQTTDTKKRFFDGVVIKGQEIEELKTPYVNTDTNDVLVNIKDPKLKLIGIEGIISIGGNRLLIAAKNDDWQHLQSLLKQVDQEEPTVILDVFMVDITNNHTKKIAADMRNLTGSNPMPGLEYLSSQMSAPGVVLGATPTQLAQDLLGPVTGGNIAKLATTNSLIISLMDPKTPGIYGLIEILDFYTKVRIVDHPFLVSVNNKLSSIESSTVKRVNGPLDQLEAGVFNIPIVNLNADFKIEMTPHLSRECDKLQLEVTVIVDNFIGTSLNRQRRHLNTTVSIKSGQIFAMGGIFRENIAEFSSDVPILSKLPIIGPLFQQTQSIIDTNNIVIFIVPTIVQPKLKKGAELYSYDRIEDLKIDYNNNRIVSNTRDPIDRLFFKLDAEITDSIFETSGIIPKRPDTIQGGKAKY